MVVELRDFAVRYSNGPAFEHLSLAVSPGERVGLAGESGCGKTTLIRAITGLLPKTAAMTGFRQVEGRIGYVPQEGLHSLSPFLKIGTQVSAPEWLERVELGYARISRSYPHQLSGGERQRVLVAQALALRPNLIVADEPTANLDPENERSVLELFDRYAKETGAAMLIASHRERVFKALGCRVHRITPAFASAFRRVAPRAENVPLLSIRDLTKTYVHRDGFLRARPGARALDAVSLDLTRGEFVAIGGPSGAGKSTLARCIAGRERWESGSLEWRSGTPLPLPDRVQLVPQEPSGSLNPRFSIRQALDEAGGGSHGEMLTHVGLPGDWLERGVSALSEGQRARVAILRSASRVKRGGLLILDESLSGLDPATQAAILEYLSVLREEGEVAVLWITHDLDVAEQAGARTVQMAAGRIAA